jgi:hypothetical protein
MVPPFQSGAVEPYLVRGTWFPSRLQLKETDRIQTFQPQPMTHDTQGTRPNQFIIYA